MSNTRKFWILNPLLRLCIVCAFLPFSSKINSQLTADLSCLLSAVKTTVSCRPASFCLCTGLEFNQKVASLSCQHLKHVKITMMNIIVLVELGGLEPLTLGIQSLVFNKLDHLLRVSRIPKDGFSERRKTWTKIILSLVGKRWKKFEKVFPPSIFHLHKWKSVLICTFLCRNFH